MGEVWAAAVGAAVAVAGTAYSVYQSQAAIDASNSARPPKFVPIDIGAVAGLAAATDKAGYDASDADWAARFPALSKGRDYSIEDAKNALQGKADPNVTNALTKAGVNVDIGGNPFQQAEKLGLPILSKEQRDRTYFAKLLSDNPQRQFGLSGQDVAHIAIANTNSQNNFNQGLFGSRINAYNSQIQQSAQATQGIVSGITGAVGIGAQLYQNNQLSNYLNSDYYRNDPVRVVPYGTTGDASYGAFVQPNPAYSPNTPPPPPGI